MRAVGDISNKENNPNYSMIDWINYFKRDMSVYLDFFASRKLGADFVQLIVTAKKGQGTVRKFAGRRAWKPFCTCLKEKERGFFVGGALCSAWVLLPGNGKLYLSVLKGGEQDANVRLL
ncbi:hypothetical protein IMSAGC005_01875 [Lachnospiraceae bacterium]|nr:hypothetical protein IMSAGC005_01875 [Lachnospiraceae bacterium]